MGDEEESGVKSWMERFGGGSGGRRAHIVYSFSFDDSTRESWIIWIEGGRSGGTGRGRGRGRGGRGGKYGVE